MYLKWNFFEFFGIGKKTKNTEIAVFSEQTKASKLWLDLDILEGLFIQVAKQHSEGLK